jgi:hypothetical protein
MLSGEDVERVSEFDGTVSIDCVTLTERKSHCSRATWSASGGIESLYHTTRHGQTALAWCL